MTEGKKDSDSNTKFKDGVNRNARLIVRNLPFKATEEDLKKHFSRFGTVEEVKLLKRPDGKLVGCGFVHFTHVPMANKALAATNKKPFLDRPIHVAWAVPKFKYGEKEQNEDPERKVKSSGSKDIVEIEDDNMEDSEENKKNNKTRVNRNARLIVRNVSFKATEESLREHFQPYGEVLEAKLLKKSDGRLVGCAFVLFKNVPMAKKALLNTNMKAFLGRPISVDWAVAKDRYMQHIVNKQLEMENEVKKEDSDSDDDGPPLNISTDDLKAEVKSESGDSDDDDKKDVKGSDDESGDSDDQSDDDEEEEDEDDDDEEDDDNEDAQSETSTQVDRKRIQLNDAEDGLTIFLTNIPFSVDDNQLREFVERTAPVSYALICVDRLTEHSKGSGFVKFTKKEDADTFLALPPEQLRLDGQVLQAKPALNRESLQKSNKKQPKDNRNLYLVKEGVVVAGTKAAEGVSASDMAKRLALERSKTQMLKNLNRFVSRYRLVVSNLPPSYDDARLRRLCAASGAVTECRVMRDLRAPTGQNGKHPSKGYGFVMFTKHEDALACLRKLNNNPDIFDRNNRPIVSFSIEDRTALNARKKRLEKSIANNPQGKNTNANNTNNANFTNNSKYPNNAKNKNNANNEAYNNRKRKGQQQPDESFIKKKKFDNERKWESNNNQGKNKKWQNRSNQNEPGKFVKPPKNDDIDDYAGLTAKEGAQHKLRSNHKLRAQADIHRQQVKAEKKRGKHAQRMKKAARERVKQPKQKVNKNPVKKNKRRKFKPTNIKDILK